MKPPNRKCDPVPDDCKIVHRNLPWSEFVIRLCERAFFWYCLKKPSSIKNIKTMSYLDNIRTFVRVYELGSMSAAGRDLRISPAVTSSRISHLEQHLSVRLFQRTTRSLTPTEQGKAFYSGASEILEAVESAEAQVVNITDNPKGSLYVAAPLGVGRRLIAPLVPG